MFTIIILQRKYDYVFSFTDDVSRKTRETFKIILITSVTTEDSLEWYKESSDTNEKILRQSYVVVMVCQFKQ